MKMNAEVPNISAKISQNEKKKISNRAKEFICDLCDKVFSKKNNLFIHRKIHTGEKLFSCDICNNSFITKQNLSRHRRTHTGEKPFVCDMCEKTFTQKSNLTEHRRIHTGERPFKCDVCEKSFSRRDHLNAHQKLHRDEKSYSCEICQASFKLSSNLSRHKKTPSHLKQIEILNRAFSGDYSNIIDCSGSIKVEDVVDENKFVDDDIKAENIKQEIMDENDFVDSNDTNNIVDFSQFVQVQINEQETFKADLRDCESLKTKDIKKDIEKECH